ncbi:cohesin subunit SMC3 KNAG_0B05230 [Huiozyma naganishii CBS 8797]|uniref:Structural maintenance of chromosomes protein n=1 Tax=Huiozyma naganishii (strain ATCC MYA-139 / BCRC 22969 / CBS 8797 / KCTC 17520 / NBRC 10181 / NCYC 3082 / Yp74L-3) TaxID=1071383 RepID=J7S543_HUIN7|nr:hypothetical protein KNAG_0B05230 [Kazachstania naganishii CBS 8797]CCK68956.1 hypothetical protein KNAG_0B05230 [Kazachstania naganishii CBS 8797]
MYIKRVVIKGFKTYRNETIIDNFSPHHNIVIGSNGSGKSNFFAAIRFVLSDDYSNLKREERQGLIHQGSGSVMSASVEIVFHDPDHRIILSSGVIPRPNDEVFVRRTVGLKKDDYQINDRNVTKSDLVRMLESAGFSMGSPYNIVPQGRIIALTNAKDKERLLLLEDVIGAKSFETKLRASLKNMKDTEFKRNQIMKEMDELKGKLKEMEEERKELERYNNMERNRKVFQFTLYDRELSGIINQIESLDDNYNSTVTSSEQYIQELDKREGVIEQVTSLLQRIDNKLKLKTTTDLEQAKAIQLEISNRLGDLNIKIKDLKRQIASHDEQNNADNINLNVITKEIQSRRAKLLKILPRFEALTKEEAQYKLKLAQLQQRQRDLRLKKGNYARFETKEERNQWIEKEILEQQELLHSLQKTSTALIAERQQLQSSLSTLDMEIEELSDSVEGPGTVGELEDVAQQLTVMKEKYVKAIDERKELWRTEQKLLSVLDTLSDDVRLSERALNETMNKNLANGISSIKEITEKLKLSPDAVFGTLGELLKVSEKYKTCAEVVGGNSLFHVVVDTDKTASLLMRELYKMKGGRVTFMPLNRLHEDSGVTFPPQDQSAACTPLLKKIKYDAKFEKAVKHVFGKTIVVRDLTTGVKMAKSYQLNAITLDGDRADNRGVLTGGYLDQRKKTRLDALKALTNSRNQHELTNKELHAIKGKLQEIDTTIDNLNGEMRNIATRKETILANMEQSRMQFNKKKSQKVLLNESLMQLSQKMEKNNLSIKAVEDKISNYKDNLTQDFENELSANEKEELESVSQSVLTISNELDVTTESLESITSTIDQLNAELDSKLVPQEILLKSKLSDVGDSYTDDLKKNVDALMQQQHLVSIESESAVKDVDEIQKEIDSLTGEKNNNEKILEKANSQQRSLLKKIEGFQKDVEKNMIKKTTLTARRDELQQKIREIGLLAEDALNKFTALSSEDLLSKLNEVNKNIAGLSNVNKRAFENFKRFNEKQRELSQRAAELEESKVSIQDLIERLKQQKISAVDNTFKKVSDNFVTVFEQLVPKGTARLIIHKNTDKGDLAVRDEDVDEDVNMDGESQDLESVYTGVSISVSFSSKKNEQLRVEQLSGGQKTVCAIALILAIQMVDPAPFYLFDEIDAALDKQYRTSVANAIKKLSKNAQFICTTFRTDMLAVADRFYRVKYENKISTIIEINKQDAMSFVRGSNKFSDV